MTKPKDNFDLTTGRYIVKIEKEESFKTFGAAVQMYDNWQGLKTVRCYDVETGESIETKIFPNAEMAEAFYLKIVTNFKKADYKKGK